MLAFRFRVCLVLDYCCCFGFSLDYGFGLSVWCWFCLLVSWVHAPFDCLVWLWVYYWLSVADVWV